MSAMLRELVLFRRKKKRRRERGRRRRFEKGSGNDYDTV